MYDRNQPNHCGLKEEFFEGIKGFIAHAKTLPEFRNEGTIRCPCVKYKCTKLLQPENVKVHIYSKGFRENYYVWTVHGENYCSVGDVRFQNLVSGERSTQMENNVENSRLHEMVSVAFGFYPGVQSQQNVVEPPNDEAKHFYESLESASCPLYKDSMHSELSVVVRLLTIKSYWNIFQVGMNAIIGLMCEVNPSNNLPNNYYKAKKLVSKLGLSSTKIDCCENGCMLHYKDDAALEACKFCGLSRFKEVTNAKGNKVAVKKMHYLPIIPRLKRMYASMSSAPHMRWHHENRRSPGVLCHPLDGEAWKHFDRMFPNFANKPKNVRLGLCVDGFTPFSVSAAPYSCWPVFVTLYNLPPEMCMKSPYLFLTCIVSGPSNPKGLIDVYLQPLIDDLKLLWHEGVETYDISTKQNFRLRASLMWTINDFSAYGMLYGWSTTGKSCPYCMEDTKSFTLRHGGKNTWFDCHRRFLPMDHEFRRNISAFMKNQTDYDEPPPTLSGEEIWERVKYLPKVMESSSARIPGYGIEHNWTKQSIFWELPYWKHNLLRHNLDVMHIEKNFFDNLFNTVMDDKNKTKDNLKARMDLQEYCRRRELELKEVNNRLVKPKASYTYTLDDKQKICDWVRNLKMPDGYASNLSRGTKVHPQYKIVEVKHTKEYQSYDPFVIAQNVKQVYYASYPSTCKNKNEWWVVIKTKTVGKVEVDDSLVVAYQNDISSVQQTVDNELEYELHSEGIYEEVDLLVEQNYGIGTFMANAEEDSGDENEFIEEEEFSDEIETSEEDETDDENVASDDDGMDDGNETSDDDN
uniref:Uncharacterized protein LOC104248805 n=1 Tax=Nicotiana sylvestris TaxID=4096 RepID=A0A1U7YJY3_NICSY